MFLYFLLDDITLYSIGISIAEFIFLDSHFLHVFWINVSVYIYWLGTYPDPCVEATLFNLSMEKLDIDSSNT